MGEVDTLFIHVPKTGGTTVWNVLKLERYIDASIGPHFEPKSHGMYNFDHRTMQDMLSLNLVTPEFLERAYKFAFVRNPYDRTVSNWAFSIQHKRIKNKYLTLLNYCKEHMPFPFRPERQWEVIQGPPELDFLGRFENFKDDLQHVANELGIGKIKIPHFYPTRRGLYREVIDKESKKIIEEFYAEDFERFGYELEDF